MVGRDRRLLIVAENEAGGTPWNQLAYERLVEATPFMFRAPADLLDPDRLAAGCRAARGPPHAPLFLLIHGIDTDPTPRPSNADRVNARAALLARAAACERVRRRPTWSPSASTTAATCSAPSTSQRAGRRSVVRPACRGVDRVRQRPGPRG
ncbi:MAG TPA: hypothetical protein VN213_10845 [Solirubrobacteraceae bacterium]|nr:hypothetical protein [Solirubrobacteraceae bacterium]